MASVVVALALTVSCSTGRQMGDASRAEVDDTRLLWSPYSWIDVPGGRVSASVGAYVDVAFEGDTVGIVVDLDRLNSAVEGDAALVVGARVDDGPVQRKAWTDAVDDRLDWKGFGPGAHRARIMLVANGFTRTRWNGKEPAGLQIDAVVASGRILAIPESDRKAPTALFYGDSLVEGNNVEENGSAGDNSFAVVAMDTLGYRYGIHAYSMLAWQVAPLARAGVFAHVDEPTVGDSTTWMNYTQGRPMVEADAPHRFLEGAPDLVLNDLGSNDGGTTSNPLDGDVPSLLRRVVPAWISQVRAATGPDTVIVMIEPLMYDCPYPYLERWRDGITQNQDAYRAGIAQYREANPDDHRFLDIRLGDEACRIALDQVPLKEIRPSVHFNADTSQKIGKILAARLDRELAALPE